MYGVVHGAYRCYETRTEELSDRIFERNIPSAEPQMQFDPRPTETRHVLFPMIECHQPSETPVVERHTHTQTGVFHPGTTAPPNGYQNAIDNESRIQNRFFPHQTAVQSKFIPSSGSDLYVSPKIETTPINEYNLSNNPHSELYCSAADHARETWDQPHPNPHKEIGNDLFYNHTRVQVKDLTC